MEFPKSIAERVFELWERFSLVPNYQPVPRPPLSVLTALMNTCFFASLKREEGRTVQFELALCSQSQLGDAAYRFSQFTKIFNLIRFDESKPRKLSEHELVRLAPACDPDKTILLATYENENDGLSLWGVVDVDWRSGTSIRLDALRIRVSSPGEMTITLHGRELCTYKDGHVREPVRGLVNEGPIYGFFKEASLNLCREVKTGAKLPADTEPIHERDYRAMAFFFVLQKVIEEIQRLKHGGCILFVLEGKTVQNFENLNIKYPCRDETVWNCLRGKGILQDRFHNASDSARGSNSDAEELVSLQNQRYDVKGGLRDALAAIVRFTAVDGAVLMNRKFELLGFGAVVKLSQRAEGYQIYRCLDRQGKQCEPITIEDYGTRHRSAFEFCYSCKDSVAIVVSQDGGIKIVTRVGDNVYFWENISFDLSNEI